MKINRFFKVGATTIILAVLACVCLKSASADFPNVPRPNIPKPNIPSVPKPTRPNFDKPARPTVDRSKLLDAESVRRPYESPEDMTVDRSFVDIPTREWVADGFPLAFSRDYPVVSKIWQEFDRRENAGNMPSPDSVAVHNQLQTQGEKYKGKLLRVQGRLLRAVERPTPSGIICYDLWILLPDSEKNPIRVLARRAPSGFQTDSKLENERAYDPDVKYRDEKVDLVGLYYRTTAFNAGDDIYSAPTFVALGFSVDGMKDSSTSSPSASSSSSSSSPSFFGMKKNASASNQQNDDSASSSSPPPEERRRRNRYISKAIKTIVFAALMWGWYFHSSRKNRWNGGAAILVAFCLAPGLAEAQDGVEFWAKATGSTVEATARETSEQRPSPLDPAPETAERRAFLVALIQRVNGALDVDVLRERSNDEYVRTHSLGEYVATASDARPDFATDADVRFYLGRVLDAAPLPLNEAERERTGCETLYRVLLQLENSDAKAILYAPSLPAFDVPDAFFESGADDAARKERRVAAIAVKFGLEREGDALLPAGVAPKLGWYPTASPLAARGVDLAAFEKEPIFPPDALAKTDDVDKKREIARTLRWTEDDRFPFYETLAASKTAGALGGKRVDDVVELFNRPENWQGAEVRLRGWTRRVNQVLVDDPIVKAELGIERYYQIYFFTNDSQGRALVLCAAELPDGLNVGGGKEFRKEIEVSGVFYKTWAFKKLAPNDATAKESKKEWTSAPVLVGRVDRVEIEAPSPAPPVAPSTILTLFAFLALAWIVLRRVVFRRERERQIHRLLEGRHVPE